MKKLLRVVSYVTLAITIVVIIAWVANEIWFVVAQPEETKSANYSGTWKSEDYSFVSGRILVELPSSPPKGQAFTVKAFVYYNTTCLYRTGRFVPMEMEAFIEDSGLAAGSNDAHPVFLPGAHLCSDLFGRSYRTQRDR